MPQTARQIIARVKRAREEKHNRERRGDGGDRVPPLILPPPSQPMQVARVFVEQCCKYEGMLTLRHWRGGWWTWQMSHWREQENRAVRSFLYAFTEQAFYLHNDLIRTPWAPTRRKIADLLEALSAICILADDISQPNWLDGRTTGTIVAVRNGLLDIERNLLLARTPQFFNQTAVPFDFDVNAAKPTRWLGFLHDLWPEEVAAVDALGEWFGYVVSGRLDLHKILLMVGPTRGGKGVIARVLTSLVGHENVAGPTLNSLGGDFGLAPLIGKPLAIISDARFTGTNGNIVVERLLSISGEDTLTVNRKYRDQWTGRLPCRLHVISNELPKLGDASAAIIGRIILLLLSRSWLGNEDRTLESALKVELSGILNWALEGLKRLTIANGNRFTRLASADEAIITLQDLASPVAAFVRQRCVVGSDKTVAVDQLFEAYKVWCDDSNQPKTTKQVFARDLKAAFASIRDARPGTTLRIRVYLGIGLRDTSGDSDGP